MAGGPQEQRQRIPTQLGQDHQLAQPTVGHHQQGTKETPRRWGNGVVLPTGVEIRTMVVQAQKDDDEEAHNHEGRAVVP